MALHTILTHVPISCPIALPIIQERNLLYRLTESFCICGHFNHIVVVVGAAVLFFATGTKYILENFNYIVIHVLFWLLSRFYLFACIWNGHDAFRIYCEKEIKFIWKWYENGYECGAIVSNSHAWQRLFRRSFGFSVYFLIFFPIFSPWTKEAKCVFIMRVLLQWMDSIKQINK